MPALRRIATVTAVAAVTAVTAASGPGAGATPAPGAGGDAQRPVVAFRPRPLSEPRYGTRPPSADPAVQRTYVEAHDGVDLYVETWLPATKDGRVPPGRVPTILVMTPYVSQGVEEYPANDAAGVPSFIGYMTARGYAVAQHHVRGTGESGGCLEQTARSQIDDGARIVEYLGRDAPWSDGNVGMYGISYDAETQISVAGLGDRERIRYLKAIVPAASVAGQYEYSFFDGVPYAGQALLSNSGYLAGVSATPGAEPTPQKYAEKLTCQPEVMASSADQSGDMTPFWLAREYRAGAERITAATLYVHGLVDFNVQPITLAGWLDRLPVTTPHKGLVGIWNHSFPYRHPGVRPEWARADWFDMVTAWYDRYLKGLPTGVESWPDVQVQASTGEWRAAPEFPTTGDPVGQLALGPGGTLGAMVPEGSTQYVETVQAGTGPPQGQAGFETEPLRAPLHLTGQPVLDLWLKTDRPDGHVAARLQVVDADGAVQRHTGSAGQQVATYGFRSLRHLDPMPDNWFRQEQGKAPPIDTPIRVTVRFHPTDLVVPAGGRLRLTVAGSIAYTRTSEPSGLAPVITLLHDCTHPSALRFLLPDPDAPLLDVREIDEDELPTAPHGRARVLRDGGLARAEVCGRAPERHPVLGPERPAAPPAAPPPAGPQPPPAAAPPPAAPPPAAPLPATGGTVPLLAVGLAGAAALLARRARRTP